MDHELLRLNVCNLLARGGDPEIDQSLHVDGLGYRIIVIIPLQHGGAGYKLRYVKGSHRINWEIKEGGVEQKIMDTIPESTSRVISASRDEMILFSERLLHGGGRASTYKDGEERDLLFSEQVHAMQGDHKMEWLRGSLCSEHPTDMAIQITYDYNLVSSGARTGRSSNIWAVYERSEDEPAARVDIQTKLGMLASTVDHANDQFIKTMKEAERAWMKSIVDNEKYNIASKRREACARAR